MLKEWFEGSAILGVPVVVMFFFIAVFVGVVIWVLSRRRSDYEHVSHLPLDDDHDRHDRHDTKPRHHGA